MNYFYGRVQAVYGSKFKSQFPSDEDVKLSKAEWAGQVMNLGKTDIDRGVDKLKALLVAKDQDYLWVNIPLIAALCQPKPEDYGMPNTEQAWEEAEQHCHHVDKHRWSHEAVRVAGKRTGWFEIMGAVSDKRRQSLKDTFERHYRYLAGRVMDGKSLQTAQALLESDSNKKPVNPAERSAQYNDRKQRDAMKAQGINPAGGYAEFKKRMGLSS
ncbi:hypothetical protein GZ77_20600 [Endozoicomonas montiporae]|uniref:Replication protein n=2 Tax=Endozoicomonas montiporae TaxID=1027273 RepID=A0A081N323_9GAMM|nr:hypothetical protein EZMO1_4214 [Endozoicomonas montiporae CL-33]KEQ12846.1 hypothetical protein GZ77_20600 [Endozoicomonas montiporae]